MSHIQFIDEVVREYLVFRGFSATAKAFDSDLKQDKDKGFRVDRIVDQLLQSISNYDLTGLRECWSHLDNRLFTRLEAHFAPAIRKLESAVLKLYLVNASENNKQDKITEFFTRLTPDLLGQSEWKDWFVLPFIKNPEEHAVFAVYFTRQWQDSVIVSLHNFLAAVYQCMPQPTLSSFEESVAKMSELQKENEIMRKGIANLLLQEDKLSDKPAEEGMDLLMDDFYFISQEIKSNETQAKMLKTIMRNIGSMPASPKAEGRPTGQGMRTGHRMTTVRRTPQTKRSLSIDRCVQLRVRERDSSLDLSQMRNSKESGNEKKEAHPERRQEGSFLFLSQEEYGEHKCLISCIKINHRGNLVASADIEGNMKVWSVSPTCKTTATHSTKSSILCLSWVPNHERYIIYGTSSGVIGLYDIKDLKLMWEITVDNDKAKVDEIICSPMDSLIIAVSSGKLFLVDLKLRKVEKSFNIPCEAVCAKMNHNGQVVIVGTSDGSVLHVDMRKNEIIDKWETHSGSILQMELTSDYTFMYTLGEDNRICCKSVNFTKGKATSLIVPADVKSASTTGRIFCLDNLGRFLLTVGVNSGVIYKITDSNLVKSLELGGHKTKLTCVDWSFANQCATCVTASQDGKIKISTLLVDSI